MLIDTSGFLCFLDKGDFRHQKAAKYFISARSRVSHNYVVAELVAFAESRNFSREITLDFLSEISEDSQTEIIWVSENLTERSIKFLRNRKDKDWSLCDAVSFLLMEEYGISEALTTDHHFEQAGFIKLLDS